MFNYQPELQGELVRIAPATEADFEALFALASDPDIWAMHPQRNRHQREIFRAFFDSAQNDRGGVKLIEAASGKVIGFSRYSTKGRPDGEVEIGWTFYARRVWGQGHNDEVKALMLSHAFATFGTVCFHAGETNLRSRRAIEKLGAKLTDERVNGVGVDGKDVNVTYLLTCADWHSVRQ